MKKIIIVFGIGVILCSCGNETASQQSNAQLKKNDSVPVLKPNFDSVFFPSQDMRPDTSSRLKEIVQLLNDKKFEQLAVYVHPEKGLRFSPYTTVVKTDLVFTNKKLKNLFSDKTVYNWGKYQGSGEPIKLAFKDYYKRFIFNEDFLTIGQVSVNDFSSYGNMVNNIKDFYPGCKTLNYFCPPSKTGNNMDWAILRIVFQEKDGKLFLVGIVHDQWTI